MEGLNHILYAIIILVNDFVLRVMKLNVIPNSFGRCLELRNTLKHNV